MRILMIDNFTGTDAGLVGQALEEAGAAIDRRDPGAGDALPETPDGYDGLVMFGGPQDALADDAHPYLPHLAGLTRSFGDSGRAVLGICLGSQIVARAHGARNIVAAREPRPTEFGWLPVTPTDAGRDDPIMAALDDGAPMFHWHSDTFTLPEGAVHLAMSEMTPHQGFRIGRKVYATQFHFEADRPTVQRWAENFGDMIDAIDPTWRGRREQLAAENGPACDRAGLAMARAWVRLL